MLYHLAKKEMRAQAAWLRAVSRAVYVKMGDPPLTPARLAELCAAGRALNDRLILILAGLRMVKEYSVLSGGCGCYTAQQ